MQVILKLYNSNFYHYRYQYGSYLKISGEKAGGDEAERLGAEEGERVGREIAGDEGAKLGRALGAEMARLAGAKVGRKIGLTAGAVAGRKAGAKACILAVDTAIQEVSRDKVAALRVLFAEIAFKAGMFDSIYL